MLAYAEPGTDNMLAGLQTGTSYAQLSRDMSPAMLPAMTESQCSSLCTLLDTNVGAYVSRQVSGVEENDDFITVVYDARYQNKDRVTGPIVYVRFHGAGPRYSGRYSVEDLNIWTGLLRDLAAGTATEPGRGRAAGCTSTSTTTRTATPWPMPWSCGRCSAHRELSQHPEHRRGSSR